MGFVWDYPISYNTSYPIAKDDKTVKTVTIYGRQYLNACQGNITPTHGSSVYISHQHPYVDHISPISPAMVRIHLFYMY